MKLRQLFEAPRKVAVAAFGRMNPPTVGHEKLVNKVKSFEGDHYIFLSQTQKPKTDPLPFDVKLEFAKKFFPDVNVGHTTVRTPIQMLQMLEKLGYTDIIYVAGSDRVESFEKLFNDYNGKEYNFNSITVENAGERDPDAEGVEGMSASKLKKLAAEGKFEDWKDDQGKMQPGFARGVPKPELAQKMYDAVRTGMGIKAVEPAEGVVEGEDDNFTIDDIKRLERIKDLETIKAQAKELIKGKPARRMKPEKISYFYNKVDSLTSPFKVIKLMYDLLLAGEGHKVVGSRNSMSPNVYRQRFGDSIENEASYEGNLGLVELFKFFSKAEKEDPKLVARVKKMIKQRRDKEVWRIVQDYTGTQLTGKEFEGSIKETIFQEANYGKYWCSTDKKWKYRKGPKQSRSS